MLHVSNAAECDTRTFAESAAVDLKLDLYKRMDTVAIGVGQLGCLSQFLYFKNNNNNNNNAMKKTAVVCTFTAS